MRLPDFDPKAIQIEDQRGFAFEPEGLWDSALRGIGNNWNRGGLAALLGIDRWFTPPPAHDFHGNMTTIDPNLVAAAPLVVYPGTGASTIGKRPLKSGAV